MNETTDQQNQDKEKNKTYLMRPRQEGKTGYTIKVNITFKSNDETSKKMTNRRNYMVRNIGISGNHTTNQTYEVNYQYVSSSSSQIKIKPISDWMWWQNRMYSINMALTDKDWHSWVSKMGTKTIESTSTKIVSWVDVLCFE